jgi:hypothetical protein
MVQIRRSKTTQMALLNQLKELRNDAFTNPLYSIKDLSKYLYDILEVRRSLIINEDFTLKEYNDTKKFIELLNEEKYEEIAKLNYKIIEDED